MAHLKTKDLGIIFDTNIYINFRALLTRNHWDRTLFSSVVLYELTARPLKPKEFDVISSWRDDYSVVTPTAFDWEISADAVRKLRLDQQKTAKGKTPPMENPTELQNDALIARSAFEAGCFVVTENVDDFALLRKYMHFDYISARKFFNF